MIDLRIKKSQMENENQEERAKTLRDEKHSEDQSRLGDYRKTF